MLILPETEAYASKYTSVPDPLLQEVIEYTLNSHAHSQMLSSPEQGLLLSFISGIMRPARILEIGTFTGFSGLCLASGLADGGELHTIELREDDAATARSYFERSAYMSKIRLHIGNATDIIPTLAEAWDIVFIDADKTGYIQYYEMVLPALKPGGIIIADNVLYHGEVLKEPLKGKNAIAISAFNEHIKQDQRVQHVLVTVRDGLMLIRKRL